ncbi:MAG: acetoin utilization protein AcuC [Deltaproteobacteria bacterium]|nr:acetoin utilization protein AcuC [Deltaproteobacteria bacterium]
MSEIKGLTQQAVHKKGSLFVYSDELAWFDFGTDHPFKPERSAKTYELCNRYALMHQPWMKILKPESIEDNMIHLFHNSKYIDLLKDAEKGDIRLEMLEHGIGTSDNPILSGILEWSLKVTGGTVAAMNQLMQNNALVAFNPLGGFHHAKSDQAEGFCYVNDIAIAIKEAIRQKNDIKVVYIDIDAHHGNGVQEAFYDDPTVLVISIHETGKTLYPWVGFETEMGEGDGKGFTVNVPIEAGSDDEVFLYVFDNIVPPLFESFSPDVVVAELGADTMISDPLTHLKLTNNSYQNAIKKIVERSPRLLALGGGGYDLFRTARCWTLAWSIMNFIEPLDELAGLVGGMMFGPESEVGSLYDRSYASSGEIKDKAMSEAQRVMTYIQKEIFPIHGI